MAVAGSLTYDTKLDTNGLQDGLNKLSSTTVAMGNLMADAFRQVANAMAEVVKQGVTYNAQIEQYQVALTTLTGSAEEANRIMTQIKEDAAKTPFDVAGLTQANQLLISAGVGADDAREDIIALGNAISATGGGNEELSRMAVNLQQIKNVGQASALDIRQFAYAGIDLYGLLADYMGITKEEATELEITYEQLTGALKYASQEGGKYFGAMENQSKTLNGQISTLKDNFMTFAGSAAEPLFNFLKDEAIPILNDILSGEEDVEDAIPRLTDTLVKFISNTLQSLIKMMPKMAEMGINILFSLIQGIVETIPELIPTMVDVILNIVDTIIDNLDLIIIAAIDIIVALAIGLVDAIPILLEKIPEIIVSLTMALTSPEMIMKLLEAGVLLLIGLARGIYQAIPELLALAPRLILEFFNSIKDRILNTDWKQLGKNMLNGILNGMLDFGTAVYNTIKRLGNKIVSSIKSFFGIKSPSRLMRDEIGKYIPQGIAVGIEADTDSALSSIDKMNDEIMDRMSQAVNIETAKASFNGISGSVSQILSANSVIQVENYNTLELDGEKVYENQQTISKNKNLQYGFGGASVK